MINTRLLIGTIATLATAATLAATVSPDAAATPVVTGCPAGFSLFAVQPYDPSTYPYRLPALLDSQANGGNGDGYVCALALPEAVAFAYCQNHEPGACSLYSLGLPLYEFTEDNNPARGAASAVIDFGE